MQDQAIVAAFPFPSSQVVDPACVCHAKCRIPLPPSQATTPSKTAHPDTRSYPRRLTHRSSGVPPPRSSWMHPPLPIPGWCTKYEHFLSPALVFFSLSIGFHPTYLDQNWQHTQQCRGAETRNMHCYVVTSIH